MRKTGMKFGLIGSASSIKKPGKPGGKDPARRRPPPSAAANVFEVDSDGDDKAEGGKEDPNGVKAVNRRLAAVAAKQDAQAKKDYAAAMAEDPSLFDYDRVYDGMKESDEKKKASAVTAREKEKRQPKYIGNLLKQAKLREIEADKVFERKLQKEREEQDKLEGEATMKFVTSAYKKKLMEQKKWELQQQLEEAWETSMAVEKKGMGSFYSNLMSKNIAMGGDVEKLAQSAFTTGSRRHEATALFDMETSKPRGEVEGDRGKVRGGSGDPERGVKGGTASNRNGEGMETSTTTTGEERTEDERMPSSKIWDPRGSRAKEPSYTGRSSSRREAAETGARGGGGEWVGPGLASRQQRERDKEDPRGASEGSKAEKTRGQECMGEGGTRGGGVKRPRGGSEAGMGTEMDGGAQGSGNMGTSAGAGGTGGSGAEVKGSVVLSDGGAGWALSGGKELGGGERGGRGTGEEEKVAQAKAKKDATIRAAKERYLARKKGLG